MEKSLLLKKSLLAIGLISLIGMFFYQQSHDEPIAAMACVGGVVAIWWIFEVLPLGITALLPLAAYPLLGIAATKEIAPIYMSSVLLLFIGGFMVAIAMQRWNLHRRIALNIISLFGSAPPRLLAGFMMATGFLSMWISNTAATVMMVSIGLAVIASYEEIEGEGENSRVFASTIMMGIAYSATIGGIATLIGTPPNLALTRIYAMSFPHASEISFGKWVAFGIPISLVMVVVAWSCLVFIHMRGKKINALADNVIEEEKNKLGPLSYEEKCVGIVFISMALFWIFRKDLNLGFLVVPGWSTLLADSKLVDDSTVAIFMALILFMIPAKNKDNDGETGRVLNGRAIRDIPWETILLFGGGFALAKGIQMSGLSLYIGSKFQALENVPIAVTVFSLTGGMSFLTELTSNMASTEMLLPILASIAKAANLNPLSLMVPATLAASCAFMLPAATAPNAIIFGSRKVKIGEMVKVGFIINTISIIIIGLFSLFVIPHILS